MVNSSFAGHLVTFLAIIFTISVVQSAPAARIVGGSKSNPGDFPYFVDMGGCGGALIAPDAVLFAAHCRDKSDHQLVVGLYDRKNKLDYGAQDRYCEEWRAHGQYNEDEWQNNDIALCKLDKPVYIDETNVLLELNNNATVPAEKEELIVMGIGSLKEDGASSNFLREVLVPTVSNEECNEEDKYDGQITESMLCAGGEKNKDSCQGDSGGPIVKRVYHEDGTATDYHVGVVSFGDGCAKEDKPGVYARTSAAYSFIKETLCDDFQSISKLCSNNNEPAPEPSCDVELDVTVRTDIFPYETRWSIKEEDSDEELVARKYLVAEHENNHKVCLEKNTCYKFEITDEHGDGLCATQTCGTYSLAMSGNEAFASGGQFKDSETKTFCINNKGKQIEKEVDYSGTVATDIEIGKCKGNLVQKFNLEIKIDNHGGETSWDLAEYDPKTGATGDIVAFDYNTGNYLERQKYTIPSNDYYCLPVNTCYKFGIYDGWGDGLMGEPSGYYKGFLKTKEIFTGSDFQKKAFHTFCVESSNGSSSSEEEVECKDDEDFVFKDDPKKDCSWVGRNASDRCTKKQNKTELWEFCLETCGTEGIGDCSFLKAEKKKKKKKNGIFV